ncbi:hypothetical protein QBC38DRAFT_143110 [Podospora fimiseda]|uniref:Uncharacterized protein n=1 Tax=Podospora fimiseda TaxID=252190 RepID=A0AAN6YKS2_9PEZI|nr:hypothetical protein QBC38DRAFT_143110 [Podospora fimiseda]
MIIPHVAIVSGSLLAGNNANTLEAIMSSFSKASDDSNWNQITPATVTQTGWWWRVFSPVSDSIYQAVWMWERARNKWRWIDGVLLNDSGSDIIITREDTLKNVIRIKLTKRYDIHSPIDSNPSTPIFMPTFRTHDCLSFIFQFIALLIVPALLAFLTSYYTPHVGLACRSFTFLVYCISQILLSILWVVDFKYYRSQTTSPRGHSSQIKTISKIIFFPSLVLGFTTSIFTSIAGTFLQILGVYRNCLCKVPIWRWTHWWDISVRDDFLVSLGSNSAEGIKNASKFWLPTGITSIFLLVYVCYLGWWYQRHSRMRFNIVADEVC